MLEKLVMASAATSGETFFFFFFKGVELLARMDAVGDHSFQWLAVACRKGSGAALSCKTLKAETHHHPYKSHYGRKFNYSQLSL